MFKNKHVVVAMIVTPILAILGYFAVDILVSEKPHAAKEGASYELVSKPNCRYTSGVCGLKNGDFELQLMPEWQDEKTLRLNMTSLFPLQGAKIARTKPGAGETQPVDMSATDSEGLAWGIMMKNPDVENESLQIVVQSDDVLYYGEIAMTFTVYETTFDHDFRKGE